MATPEPGSSVWATCAQLPRRARSHLLSADARRRCSIGLAAVLLIAAINPAPAATAGLPSTSNPAPLTGGHRDYLPPPRSKAVRIEMTSACNPCWGETVNYTTFSQPVQRYPALRYDGVAITLLIPVQHPRQQEVTADRVRVLVDRLDLLYAAYRELLDWEPEHSSDPLGKQVFAVLPNEPSWFYGLAFAPGDSSEYHNAVLSETALDDDILSNVWVHELAHNFDLIRAWDYGPDPGHDWTTVLQTWFARRQAKMLEIPRLSWQRFEADWLRNHWQAYLDRPELGWRDCAATVPRPSSCQDANAVLLSGLLMVKAGQFISGEQMQDWLARGRARDLAGQSFGSPEQRSDDMLAALAEVTASDTRCLADYARWHRGSALDAVASRYGEPFPGCRDDDDDGMTALAGDCDDSHASVRPGLSEQLDGRDNDCNGVVDEVSFEESTVSGGDFADQLFAGTPGPAAPVLIEGTLQARPQGSASDRDSIQLAAPVTGTVLMRLCSFGPALSLAGVQTNGVGYGPLAALSGPGCSQRTTVGEPWQSFMVEQPPTESAGGDYSLLLTALPPSVEDFLHRPRILLQRDDAGAVQAQPNQALLDLLPANAELRWWQSGRGFVQSMAADQPNAWTAPRLDGAAFAASPGPLQLRLQPWLNGMPVAEPSAPYLFPDQTLVTPTAIDGRFSGAWFAPEHSGEGFLIEVLADDLMVVYWFSYDPDDWQRPAGEGRQYWFVNTLTIANNRASGTLLRFRGGRLGTQLDPDQVSSSDAGSIELVFVDDQRGVVHYEIDGRSGEYAIERLIGLNRTSTARGLSGSWFDPRHAGQGLVVQEADSGELVLLMFSYDAQQRPLWSLFNGRLEGRQIVIPEAPLLPRGGLFGRGFRPQSVSYPSEGAAALQLDCQGGELTLSLPSVSAQPQTLTLQRLTTPVGVQCSTP